MVILTILQEILFAMGRFFINPLLYVAILFAIFIGYVRVKRERKFFHIRIQNGWSELTQVFKIGFVLTIILSVLTIGAGLVLPMQFLVVTSAVTILALILFNFHLLSVAITWVISYMLLVILNMNNQTFTVFNYTLEGFSFDAAVVANVVIVIGLLLIVEGLVIKSQGARFASPLVEKTKRGLNSIAYLSKRVWILPVLFLIPANVIEGVAPWWPFFSIGEQSFGFILFPVVFGFQQVTRSMLPKSFYPRLGNYISMLGVVIVLAGVGAYFQSVVGYIALALAFIGRLALSIGYKISEPRDHYIVSPNKDGVVIAAVLPDSPAEKMGLKIGETIKRVNGQQVLSENELYEALQINAAHCRLEVLDLKKELRLTQYVVHNNDHHQIGILLVK